MPAAESHTSTHYLGVSRISGILFSLLLGILHFPAPCMGQDHSYVHYDTKDGLAGSTIYDICQDKDGFIWFATEAGLSRFDGTRFRNFTTADGLPEVEILKLYADRWGRVWIAPFKNTICYYYRGKIYTAENDSLLKKVKLQTVITYMNGDNAGNIFMSTVGYAAYILTTQQGRESFTDLAQYGRRFWFGFPYEPAGKGFIVSAQHDSLFTLVDGRLARYTQQNLQTLKGLFTPTKDGMWMADSASGEQRHTLFLKGKPVNCGLVDYEQNIWFGSAGEGVYKLVSRSFKTYTFKQNKTPEIFSLGRHGPEILAGASYNKLYRLHGQGMDSVTFYRPYAGAVMQTPSNRLVSIRTLLTGELLLGFDLFLLKRSASGDQVNYAFPIKSTDEVSTDTLLVGTGRNVVRMRTRDLAILDTIWPFRSTAVTYYNDAFYVGTTDGLQVIPRTGPSCYMGDSLPSLRYRIACFARSADGSLWVATYGGGIIGFKGNRIFAHLTSREGLSSDICRSLFVQGNVLWVGTDKGLNKVNMGVQPYRVQRYSLADGLPSNMINTIYVAGDTVYVGSPAGLTFFDDRRVSAYSRCDLRLLGVFVSGRPRPLQGAYALAHYDNNLRVEFAGISFKSGGDVLYQYRLKGLKDSWDSTRQPQLDYPSLPAGNYQLEVVAINKYGVVSNAIVLPIAVAAPFWQAWWFMVLMVGLTIASTAFLVSWRFSIVRRREQEKVSLQQRVTQLEHLALLSQMNPHFIFNCLNSIQAFIINNDLETTNQYLTEFAHLIRQTMDAAEKGTISIGNEVKYLTRYLELEKMRFGHSFDYRIIVDEQLDREHVYLPSLLLQPYVENSLRHGIRFKKDGKGVIEIRFRQLGNRLLCIVEDNGIGRAHARQFRSAVHVEYQSKGMTLAAERVKTLNRQYKDAVEIEIIDKADVEGRPTGTRIILSFPHKMLTKLS